MGKRELVLVAIFLAVGIVVYQFTAPPPPPGSEGVSVGGIFQKLKREVQGSRESATADSSQTLAVDASIRLVRINFPRSNDLTIVGTDSNEIHVEMHVTARGFTPEEAKAAAETAKIRLDSTSDAVAVSTIWSDRGGGKNGGFVNTGTIKLSIPKRLQVRLEPHGGTLSVENVAGMEIMGSRGETIVRRSTGHVLLSHTGGKLEIDGVPSLKLTARNSNGSIKNVAGTFSLDATGADLRVSDVAGPFEIESRNTDLTIYAAKLAKPPFRYNGTGGMMRVTNLKTESRIDGRNVELDVMLAAAAAVTIYSTGEDISVVAPPGGYTVNAVATEGTILLDDGTLKPGGEGEQRVTGAVRGGGPELTLRATRGDIRVRKPDGK
jgi:hypothetical protein